MKKIILAGFLLSLFTLSSSEELYAVKPPSSAERKEATEKKEKDVGANITCNQVEIKKSGCTYGRDKKSGKCYEPKEGQFYCDPATGKVKRKETKCYNLPWKSC